MGEEIGVGNLVRHRVWQGAGGNLVVLSKKEEHGNFVYECRWYNRITGSYEKKVFYGFELSRIKGSIN